MTRTLPAGARSRARWPLALLAGLLVCPAGRPADPATPPNVVLIVADDLGYAEVGCYGQKLIRTPSVDRMAAGGMRFTQVYSGSPVCAPSRCVLMTGKHTGRAAVRDNRQHRKGEEGQHPLPADEVTVAELLKGRGYVTAAAGKWGLGNWDTPGSPLKQGFDHFYGYNCQAHAHSHYPRHLYRDGVRFELPGNDGVTGDAYTQDLFEREALRFIEANRGRPFFLYLPFIVPHVAVQVPEDSLAEYRGKLGDDPPYDGTIGGRKSYLPHPAPRAGYAAMVTRMDRSVGRILDRLAELKLAENTLVIFTSDNGPTHNVGGADSTFFKSAGHLRGWKGSLYEGGIRVPFVAYWPGKVKPGTVCDTPFYFPDVLPTLCELAGVKPPEGIDGVSLVPTLLGRGEQRTHEFLYWEFPAYGGQQAVRAGDWKAVRQNLAKGVIRTELYDLAKDPSESADVSAENPDVLRRLEAVMREQHTPSADFPLPAVDRKRP
jgi:arylsulfatase A